MLIIKAREAASPYTRSRRKMPQRRTRSRIGKQRGARVLIKYQRGAIGRVSDIEAQESSTMIHEAHEAVAENIGALLYIGILVDNPRSTRGRVDRQRSTCMNQVRNKNGARVLRNDPRNIRVRLNTLVSAIRVCTDSR